MSAVVEGDWLLNQLGSSVLRLKVRNTLEIRRQHILTALRSTTTVQHALTLT